MQILRNNLPILFRYLLGRSDCVGTSGSERCHPHEDLAQDTLDKPVVEKTTTSLEIQAYSQLLHRPPSKHRFNLSSDGNRVRVRRPQDERLNPVFALHRHTNPTAGVMVWGAIPTNTQSPLTLIVVPERHTSCEGLLRFTQRI
ncbi:UNVERIFIED_CONTAM: hypothetical protein NCL1_14328 [Trichonephila clavipes]